MTHAKNLNIQMGGHASEPEKTSPQPKEPENTPDTIPFIPKGALIQYKNLYSKPAVQKTPSYTTAHTKQGPPSGKRGRTQYPEAQASQSLNPPNFRTREVYKMDKKYGISILKNG